MHSNNNCLCFSTYSDTWHRPVPPKLRHLCQALDQLRKEAVISVFCEARRCIHCSCTADLPGDKWRYLFCCESLCILVPWCNKSRRVLLLNNCNSVLPASLLFSASGSRKTLFRIGWCFIRDEAMRIPCKSQIHRLGCRKSAQRNRLREHHSLAVLLILSSQIFQWYVDWFSPFHLFLRSNTMN